MRCSSCNQEGITVTLYLPNPVQICLACLCLAATTIANVTVLGMEKGVNPPTLTPLKG